MGTKMTGSSKNNKGKAIGVEPSILWLIPMSFMIVLSLADTWYTDTDTKGSTNMPTSSFCLLMICSSEFLIKFILFDLVGLVIHSLYWETARGDLLPPQFQSNEYLSHIHSAF